MSAFADFLQQLFEEGTITYREPPSPRPPEDRAAVAMLERVFSSYRLEVAGPPIDFAPTVALAAAELLRHAGWFFFSRREPDAELDRLLVMPRSPSSPADHLSADLTLRYLPQVYQRAYALEPADYLVARLTSILRQWPMSGVLSTVQDGPQTAPDFNGHPGLLLLYAERLARHEKRAWVPQGKALEYVELVYAGLCRRVPQPVAATHTNEEKEDARV